MIRINTRNAEPPSSADAGVARLVAAAVAANAGNPNRANGLSKKRIDSILSARAAPQTQMSLTTAIPSAAM